MFSLEGCLLLSNDLLREICLKEIHTMALYVLGDLVPSSWYSWEAKG